MKTSPIITASAIALALGSLAAPQAFSQASAPTGALSASPTRVQTGTKPTLKWNITYPMFVSDYAAVNPVSTVTPNENMLADIRVIGAGVTTITKYANGTTKTTYLETVGKVRYNGGGWTTIFDGKNTDSKVQTQAIVSTLSVNAGQPISFGGYYISSVGAQSPFYSSGSPNVRTLINGDTPPANLPVYYAPTLASFLKPYLDASGKISIGPMDVIVLMELTSTDPAYVGYDLQDLVLLVTFRKP